MSKRNHPAPRPPKPGEWGLILSTKEAVRGWTDLCQQARGPTATLYDHLTGDPRAIQNPERQGKLKGKLGTTEVNGNAYDQWQYEVTGGGRVWYVIDEDKRRVLITWASTGHPKQTE